MGSACVTGPHAAGAGSLAAAEAAPGKRERPGEVPRGVSLTRSR
jgi:hypothetical protein